MSSETIDTICPLCQSVEASHYYRDKRDYFQCPVCALVFVPPLQYLTPQEEKAEYDLHENTADDPGYRRFLGRLFVPLSRRLAPGSSGLDFGSGPEPTLSKMFEEAGHTMAIYDPFYAPESGKLQRQYDFITASEVVEHLHHPRQELERLWSCLKPGGTLGIMTKRVIDRDAFSSWHYKNDPTHVCFFSIETFRWFASYWGATLTIPEKDVVLFTQSILSSS
ncbi:MAG: class I SAM-dependent methyltransferase [Sedimenticola sp.]